MLRANDLVRVVIQPHALRHVADLVGKVGYIEEISKDGKRALFQALRSDGRFDTNSTGWLPIHCLEAETSPRWQEAYYNFKSWMLQVNRETQTRQMNFQEKIKQIASQYGLTVENVLAISQAVNTA